MGFIVADNLRAKVAPRSVARQWHPHEIAGAVTTAGFTASFAGLLSRDDIGEEDVIHLVSGSGRSTNLVAAAAAAHASGAKVFAHCGHDGGRLRTVVPDGVQIDCFDQQVVEDALMMRLWPGWAQDDQVLAVLTAAIERTLLAEAENLATAASVLLRAAHTQQPVGVVALDVAVVSAAAEHVAHNLSWDMFWDRPNLRPDVRFALSNGLVTAVANDSGLDAAPFEHTVGPASTQGIVLRLGRLDHLTPIGKLEIGIPAQTFDSLRCSSQKLGLNQDDEDYLCSVLVQTWGHLLMRLGRGTVSQRSINDGAAQLRAVREPIAPRLARHE